jgi:hypothetical protein
MKVCSIETRQLDTSSKQPCHCRDPVRPTSRTRLTPASSAVGTLEMAKKRGRSFERPFSSKATNSLHSVVLLAGEIVTFDITLQLCPRISNDHANHRGRPAVPDHSQRRQCHRGLLFEPRRNNRASLSSRRYRYQHRDPVQEGLISTSFTLKDTQHYP